MRKVAVFPGVVLTEEGLAMIREIAEIVIPHDESDAELLAAARDAGAIVLGPRPYITRKLIESSGSLKLIARVGVGVDSIDLEAATERGVIVTNMPEVTADSVAEFTMSLLLSLAKNTPRCDRAVRTGRWSEKSEIARDNIELNGKTHGIVGMGRIGRRVAVRCKGFGMRVLYYKRNRDLAFEKSEGVAYVPFETLIRESDTISLHLPLTNETMNLFDRPQFESMKKTALLVNQARGKVVNEEALIHALRQGEIGGYATDVYDSEPPAQDWELLTFKNVVVSPHLGGSTRESRTRSSRIAAETVVKVLRGEIPENVVNREVLSKLGVKPT